MKISTCRACNGTKKDTDGCGMRINCIECNGTGVINEDIDKEPAKELFTINKRRRGRPARTTAQVS